MQLTERQQQCVEAYERNNYSERNTARELDINVKALRSNLWLATRKGWAVPPDNHIPEAPAGFVMSHGTMHIVDGEVKQMWPRIKPDSHDSEDFINFLKQRTPISDFSPPEQQDTNENLMLEWPVFDAHHGMLAWAKETGADYDQKISRHLQVSAGKIISASFGRVQEINIILGGDNQTSDNNAAITEKSHNSLDTDSRFAKIVWCSFESAVASIEIARSIANKVNVIVLSGNHDPHSAIHLTVQLYAYFRNVDGVSINTSPEKHRFYRWGNNVFMATHGETAEKRIAPYMLNQIIERGLAQNCKRKMIRMGHLHKRGRKTPDMLVEEDGVIIERFPTLAAQEAYSIEGAYTSVRATSAVLWHEKHGRYGGREITLGEILERYPL